MKISIITIVKNGENLIEQTIRSVVNQTFSDFEYIIIDGASTDATLSIVESYKDKITRVVSEPDKGISDAFNKGVKAAQGEWILFLNAGDYFASAITLEQVSPHLDQDDSVSVVYGKIAYVNKAGNVLKTSGDEHYKERLNWHMPFPHQSTFHRRSLFDNYGFFDISFKRAMDYEFILRVCNLKAVYIPLIISNMLLGGVSQTNYRALFNECKRAHIMHFNDNPVTVWWHYFYMLWRVRIIIVIRFIIGKQLV